MTHDETDAAPAQPALNLPDLLASGYQAVIEQDPDGLRFGWSNRFHALAEDAYADGQPRHADILYLLSAISSMVLEPDTPAQPFRPGRINLDGTHSPIPEDLGADQLDWLALVAPHVGSMPLRARMADLVWLRAKRHGPQFARMAIDAYTSEALDADEWLLGAGQAWHRALQLAKGLGKPAAALVEQLADSLLAAFRAALADPEGGVSPLWFAAPLFEQRCAVDGAAIAHALAAKGREHAATNAFLVRDFFDAAGRWYERARLPDLQHEMTYRLALAWESQGDAASSGAAGRHFYAKAVQGYREVPERFRHRFDVDAAIDRSRAKVLSAGEKALGEMQPIQLPSLDVTEFVKHARSAVRGRAAADALRAFLTLERPPDRAQYEAEAMEILSGSISRLIANSTTLANDGRGVASRPPASDGAIGEEECLAQMVSSFTYMAGIIGLSRLSPALEEMQLYHQFSLADFRMMVDHSPLVPRDRGDVVAQGLHAGYCRDYVQALHILMPQFEHMVRAQLKTAGGLTTTHDDDIDMEIGLSALVKKRRMLECFGADVTFEIRALMCEQQGPNFRNQVAHGLADSAQCNSPQGIYAWWIVLRLVVEAMLEMARTQCTATTPGAEPGDQPEA